jgi:hypothetical protein
MIQEAIPHRGFGRKTLGAGFVDDVAALGFGVSVIFPSLMMGIDQGIVSERRQTFGEAINGALLCGSEHFEGPPAQQPNRYIISDKGHYHIFSRPVSRAC